MDRPGINTTEFWLALIVAVAGALSSVYVEAEWAKVAGIIAAALASMGYGMSRAASKQAVAIKEME